MGNSWKTWWEIRGNLWKNIGQSKNYTSNVYDYRQLQVQVHVSAVKENDIENTPVENHVPVGNQTMVHINVSLLGSEEWIQSWIIWGCEKPVTAKCATYEANTVYTLPSNFGNLGDVLYTTIALTNIYRCGEAMVSLRKWSTHGGFSAWNWLRIPNKTGRSVYAI